MPLHDKDSIRDVIDEEIYASTDLSVGAPKYQFPGERWSHATPTPWYTMS
jgi:glutamate decarboxylase